MPEIKTMTKDELEAYAKEQFGVDIDKHKKVAELRKQVSELAATGGEESGEEADDVPEFMRNKLSGRVYPTTPRLLKYEEMEPCDKEGNLI